MAKVTISLENLRIVTVAPSNIPDLDISLDEFKYEATDVEMSDQRSILEGFVNALTSALNMQKYF